MNTTRLRLNNLVDCEVFEILEIGKFMKV